MNLRKALEKLKADTRMKQINVKSGLITAKDIEEQTKNLPDLSAQTVKLDFER